MREFNQGDSHVGSVEGDWEQAQLCTVCKKWCHQCCSGLRRISGSTELYVSKM